MKLARYIVLVAGLILILGLTNWDIAKKRTIIAEGAPLLLRLQPIDPLSLFQGHYMMLTLAEETMPDAATIARLPYSGLAILSLDENEVGRFARLDDGTALKSGELRVRYRRHVDWRGERLDYGAQSFFFQEGDADLYQSARYALLRVSADGGTVLTDLADENRSVIKP